VELVIWLSEFILWDSCDFLNFLRSLLSGELVKTGDS